ncbi:hypothetical protein [Salibacterium halotolerans]|uniref:hypothetical protein n=1 Tax=Salibacterium halotolerans TaxID=1884432 RepID=UPI000B87CC0C|nr:hypothetical protein [Salibacterium halotolerans]
MNVVAKNKMTVAKAAQPNAFIPFNSFEKCNFLLPTISCWNVPASVQPNLIGEKIEATLITGKVRKI